MEERSRSKAPNGQRHKELLLTYIEEYLLNVVNKPKGQGEDDIIIMEEIADMIIEKLVENHELKSLLKL